MKVDLVEDRVIRGGSWNPLALFARSVFARSADRIRIEPGFRYQDLGFRLVFSRENEEEAT